MSIGMFLFWVFLAAWFVAVIAMLVKKYRIKP